MSLTSIVYKIFEARIKRLKLNLTTLEIRRIRDDLFEVYRILAALILEHVSEIMADTYNVSTHQKMNNK